MCRERYRSLKAGGRSAAPSRGALAAPHHHDRLDRFRAERSARSRANASAASRAAFSPIWTRSCARVALCPQEAHASIAVRPESRPAATNSRV